MPRRWRSRTASAVLLAALVSLEIVFGFAGLQAQTRFSFRSGQSVSPAFEGWWENDDGSFTLFFGYMNTNWEQELDIPVGPENNIAPGGPDQGQPTHFYPRRNPFLFTVRVPKDFGKQELIWTLTTNGKTERAYASLNKDYAIDKQVISTEVGGDLGSLRDELRTNIPPDLKVEGEKHRTVKTGQALTLVATARDPDNLPARRPPRGAGPANGRRGQTPGESGAGAQAPAAPSLPTPSSSLSARSGPGLRFSWMVYRGKGAAVNLTPDQLKTWMDTRPFANSPWSPPYVIPEPPPDNKWIVQATFTEPGSYVLRAVASDGSLFTYDSVTVDVTR
jgi:autonomous glycyl radical cofactor GrcA